MQTSIITLTHDWQKIADADQGFFLTVRHNALLSLAFRVNDSELPDSEFEHVLDAVNLKSEGFGRFGIAPPGVVYMKSIDQEDFHNVCVTTWSMV